jgi:hypothetical protein
MRITVDGEPIDDPGRSSADVQRCTDVALEQADIQFGFDNLQAQRRLAVAAEPAVVELYGGEEQALAKPVRFTMYANYSHFIERAEVRIFEQSQSLEAQPIDVVPLGTDGSGEWRPAAGALAPVARELKYVVRAYGANASFDETAPQPLWLVYGVGSSAATSSNEPPIDATPTVPPPEESQSFASEPLYRAYGENRLGLSTIPLSSGSVTVRGSAIPPGHTVWVAGRPVPVDASGNFIAV